VQVGFQRQLTSCQKGLACVNLTSDRDIIKREKEEGGKKDRGRYIGLIVPGQDKMAGKFQFSIVIHLDVISWSC
jgi:hypothetical protein